MATEPAQDTVDFLHEQQSSLTCRPETDERTVSDILRLLYQLDPVKIREFTSYADRNYHVKVRRFNRSIDINDIDDVIAYHLTSDDQGCQEYVLKIFNSAYTEGQHLEAEHEMMLVLKKNGIACPTPVKNINKLYKAVVSLANGRLVAVDEGETTNGQSRLGVSTPITRHAVTLLTYVPGDNLVVCAPYSAKTLYDYGRNLGAITRALQDYTHPSLLDRKYIWSLDSVVELPSFTSAIADVARRQMVHDVIKLFETEVIPKKSLFKQGTIHGDYNEQNVLVRKVVVAADDDDRSPPLPPDDDDDDSAKNARRSTPAAVASTSDDRSRYEIAGVVDFGDAARAPYVYEVAMATAYAMLDCDASVVDPVSAGGHVLAGYLSGVGAGGHQLDALERSVLRTCLVARLAQSLTLGAHTYSLNPANEYTQTTQKRGWPLLELLWTRITRDQLYRKWDDIMTQFYGTSFFVEA